MQLPFPGDEHHTPEEVSAPLWCRLCPSKRLLFYGYVAGLVLKCRRLAIREEFTDDLFVKNSLRLLRHIERCGGGVHILGLENLRDAPKPAVFVANHMSTLETFTLSTMILPHTPLAFVVKQGLLTHPVFGPIMQSQNPIAVTRRNIREDLRTVLQQGRERLEQGISVCIFPQSTRLTEFSVSRFNSLGAKLAHRSGVPVIPVALRTDFWGTGGLIRDLGPVDPDKEVFFSFGPWICSDIHSREMHDLTVEFISARLRSWGVPIVE